MKSMLQFALVAVVAFAGGFVVRNLTAPAAPEDSNSLIVTRLEGDDLYLSPRLAGSAMVVMGDSEPSPDYEVEMLPQQRVAVGQVFVRQGNIAIPCQPPNERQIPGCIPVEPPETLVVCVGGEDDGPRVCGTYTRPKPIPVPQGPLDPAPTNGAPARGTE